MKHKKTLRISVSCTDRQGLPGKSFLVDSSGYQKTESYDSCYKLFCSDEYRTYKGLYNIDYMEKGGG
jgi:hypothetical protein